MAKLSWPDEAKLKYYLLVWAILGIAYTLLTRLGVTKFLANVFYQPIADRINEKVDEGIVLRVREGLADELGDLAECVRHSREIPVMSAALGGVVKRMDAGDQRDREWREERGKELKDLQQSVGIILELAKLQSQDVEQIQQRLDHESGP